jgi:hypothetical protein
LALLGEISRREYHTWVREEIHKLIFFDDTNELRKIHKQLNHIAIVTAQNALLFEFLESLFIEFNGLLLINFILAFDVIGH